MAEIWNFYRLSLIPDSNLDGLRCYQSSLLCLVGVRHHSLRLHSQAEACALRCQLKVILKGQRIYSQFVLLRIFDAPTQDHYLDTFFVVILYICCIGRVTLLDVAITFLLTFSSELRSYLYDQIASACYSLIGDFAFVIFLQ